jgi:hypothetical protein
VANNDPNLKRRKDIADALARSSPRAKLTLEAIAIIWGTTKQRFVTVRDQMAKFPQPQKGEGNEYVYSARLALKAMLAHEKRFDNAAAARAKTTALILGQGRRENEDDTLSRHTPSQLATLSRLRAEVEERERAQGLFVQRSEVAQVCGDVFAEISDFCSRLSNEVDPHGILEPAVRSKIDKGAHEALLRVHRIMKDMLSEDVRPAAPRGKTDSAGKPRARRASR